MTAHIQFVIQKKQDTITIEDIITSILEGQRINLHTMELDLSRFDLSELVDEVVAVNISREPGIAQTIHTGVIEVQADKHLLKLQKYRDIKNDETYYKPAINGLQKFYTYIKTKRRGFLNW